jgi:hypothetical protein
MCPVLTAVSTDHGLDSLHHKPSALYLAKGATGSGEGSWLTMGRRYAMLRYAVVDDGRGLRDHSWLPL